ncbi:hypothetical protein Tco_0032433 [Tanacetum coccineum]
MGINGESAQVIQAAAKLGCLVLKCPFYYLGTRVGGSMTRVQAWQEIVEKVKSRLSKWKSKTLSIVNSKGLHILESIRRNGLLLAQTCWLTILSEVRSLQAKVVVFPLVIMLLKSTDHLSFRCGLVREWLIVAKMKVIKEESEALGLLMINDDLFTCDTPLGTIFNEFNRLSGMDDDLFTNEVKILELSYYPSGEQQMDDFDNGNLDVYKRKLYLKYSDHTMVSNEVKESVIAMWLIHSYKKQFNEYMEIKKQKEVYGLEAGMEYGPSSVDFNEWLASKFSNYMTMDWYTKNALWIYWTKGDDEEVIKDDKLSNFRDGKLIKENEIAQIFRIDTDIFHFETPLCETFKEFNYLLKIDVDVLTNDILGFKTYDEYKDAWICEWNKDIPWVADMPWLDYGPWMEPSDDIEHVCKSFRFKNGYAKWPTCIWKMEKYCNGEDLPRVIQSGDVIYFKSYEWYENLEKGELKDEALNSKAIFEGSKGVDEEPSDNARTHYSSSDEWEDFERANHIGPNANSNYNPYLDVSRILNDHAGTNNGYETQGKHEWFDEHEFVGDDDDDISDLKDYMIQKDPPYYVDEEEERSKERRCKLLGISYVKPPTCKSKKFKVVKYSFGPTVEYVAIKEYECDI